MEADRLTPESIVAAIRDGRVSATVSRSEFDSLLRRAYQAIHDRKGVIDALDRSTPGVGKPPGEDRS